MIKAVTHFISPACEPVRLYLYGIFVPALTLAGVLGYVQDEVALGIGAVVGAVLLVPATEAARSRVKPVEPSDGPKHRAD